MALALGGLALAGAVLVARGPEPGGIEDVWLLFGAPDSGAVDLPTVSRSAGDALACPPGQCRAVSDRVPPVLPVPGERLRAIVAAVAAEEPRTELAFQARWAEEDRYVVRSEWLRLPDTVAVAILGAGEGRSTLALYARPQFGLLDAGGNRARLERWLDRIEGLARAEAAR
ncbi:hypothetical protein [Methylobacterium sp. J-092]|uniref:hypothetical protein n=1 Tax=Methylobacterium sp. J-092 TaxID=2836667 RepID=UPI001FB9F2B7|nr:hypothetical protein [Methylobacterium sp. J-092]MCJ2010244.1 hypothetical protein [Methylobacterium sp. J-092]